MEYEAKDDKHVSFIREDDDRIEKLKQGIVFYQNIDAVMCWIFSWPASVLGSIVGAFYDNVELFIRGKMGGLYQKISAKGISDIDEIISQSVESINKNKEL